MNKRPIHLALPEAAVTAVANDLDSDHNFHQGNQQSCGDGKRKLHTPTASQQEMLRELLVKPVAYVPRGKVVNNRVGPLVSDLNPSEAAQDGLTHALGTQTSSSACASIKRRCNTQSQCNMPLPNCNNACWSSSFQ